MVKDAEVAPPNDRPYPYASESSTREGRGADLSLLTGGYISTEYTRSQAPNGLGKCDAAATYLNRSRNGRNHWNPDAVALGFKGFIAPRAKDGKFVDQDPLDCGDCYWGDAYYEDLPWEYPHHDMRTLIRYMGGDEKFINRHNTAFEHNRSPRGKSGVQEYDLRPFKRGQLYDTLCLSFR
ncbi:MAG: hypothetical protein Q9166_003788 [cf. Caloplaca sp. 2 TL-2023]